MKKLNRIISTLLTVCMVLGSLTGLFAFEISAAPATATSDIDLSEIDYMTKVYYTPEEKLATMTMAFEKGDYQLWVNSYTGEVATVNTATGEKLFSNPYDVGSSKAVNSLKADLLSQIMITYSSVEASTSETFNSFTDAAKNNQIKIKNIKNGIRVEYTLGREETKYLVPRLITKERFEMYFGETMKAAMEADGKGWYYKTKIENGAFFTLRDPAEFEGDQRKLAELYSEVPITEKIGAVYQINGKITSPELAQLEEWIKTYVPEYSYEELDRDHETTQYVSEDLNPPVFKMALEYTLDELGVSVTLPANGIRFDESLYQLSSVTILPYMGAGRYSIAIPNTGYTFLPDGSGAIFRFEELSEASATVGGQIYGQDYAYHTISGKYQETFRMPVYGIVTDNNYSYQHNGTSYVITKNENPTSSGFLAIMEEGEALASLKSYHLGKSAEYHTVQVSVNPRPSDTYNIADSISVVDSNSSWTVVSDRKYVGNYTIRYIMLTDDAVAAEKGITDYYPASYFGMAKAYQNYLTTPFSTGTENKDASEQTSVLERLSAKDVEKDIPLYIETFGTIETVEKILSIPVNVMAPLTTFEDIKTMYDELSQYGNIKNINFKLTGYANGGMYSTIPYGLKWESAVGGKSGFKTLLGEAASINNVSPTDGLNLGVFPDFDFAYIHDTGAFDGLSLRKHAVKTIDDRYIAKRVYTSTYQTYESNFDLAVSPAYFSRFYTKLTKNYLKYLNESDNVNALNISVATLGTDLNSDFDEDEPYNREDSKGFTIDAMKYLAENYGEVMVEGGNAYTWQYADHILDLAIDSSHYLSSSNAVPFMGIVLHGFMQYTGAPINMEGNLKYGMLKAIESGASLYFILTYQNATKLKEDYQLSQNYSVRYDIWAGSYNDEGVFETGELIDLYHELNDLTADLQNKLITGHEMLVGQRVPDADELEADIAQEEADRLAAEEAARIEQEKKDRLDRLEARTSVVANTQIILDTAESRLKTVMITTVLNTIANAKKDIEKYEDLISKTTDEDLIATYKAQIESQKARVQSLYDTTLMNAYKVIEQSYASAEEKLALLERSIAYFKAHDEYSAQFVADVEANVAPTKELCDKVKAVLDTIKDYEAQVLAAAGDLIVPSEEPVETPVEESTKVKSKYVVSDGSIVAVSYGSENGTTDATFILNYNYFDIQVEYKGQTYTIEAYGYALLKD